LNWWDVFLWGQLKLGQHKNTPAQEQRLNVFELNSMQVTCNVIQYFHCTEFDFHKVNSFFQQLIIIDNV
jgi:hypothetical protein